MCAVTFHLNYRLKRRPDFGVNNSVQEPGRDARLFRLLGVNPVTSKFTEPHSPVEMTTCYHSALSG